jgi:hypothetical protein
MGKVGAFIKYTKPHGYALVRFDGDAPVRVHPESLKLDSRAASRAAAALTPR